MDWEITGYDRFCGEISSPSIGDAAEPQKTPHEIISETFMFYGEMNPAKMNGFCRDRMRTVCFNSLRAALGLSPSIQGDLVISKLVGAFYGHYGSSSDFDMIVSLYDRPLKKTVEYINGLDPTKVM